MKSKILFISLAVVLALSVGLIGCDGNGNGGPAPSATIVIAASASENGPLSQIHDLAKKPIVETYVAANPAINGIPVEIDISDDASLLSNMLDNTDNIIDAIHVGTKHFLVGPTCTAYLERQAPLCNTGKVVQMGMEGGATSLFAELDNYEYSFFNLSFSNWFEIPVLAKMLATTENWTAADHAYIGYQNDDHGLEYLAEVTKYFAKEGITIDDSYAMDAGDTSAAPTLVGNAKAAGSAILCVFAYPEHVFGIHAISKAMAYEPKAVILGPGANFGMYGTPGFEIAEGAAEGVMCFAVANNKTTGGAGDVIREMEAAVGMPFTDYWGHPCYWAALDFIYAGAEAEGVFAVSPATFTIDQTEFRAYIASTKLDSAFDETWYVTPDHALNATSYCWADADLQFPVPDGYAGLLNYKCHTGEIGQWQGGYIEIVGYDGIGGGGDEYELTNYQVTAPFAYPKPVWP